jgi:hypothetical protein
MSVVFVTAIYDINAKRNKEIWERYAALSKIIRTYIVCSSADEERIPENAIPIFKEFDSYERKGRMPTDCQKHSGSRPLYLD